jgi:hypothetical protein
METTKFCLDRANYMREVAQEVLTDKMREACLKAADLYESLAKQDVTGTSEAAQ